MLDKGFVTILKIMFGIGGTIILVSAWTRTMTVPDRSIMTITGLIGLCYAMSTVVSIKSLLAKTGIIKHVPQADSAEK